MNDNDREKFLKFLYSVGFVSGIFGGFLFLKIMIHPPPGERASHWVLLLIAILCWGTSAYSFRMMKSRFGWFQKKD